MNNQLAIYSILDNPQYSERLKSYVASHWPPVSNVFNETLDACLTTQEQLPRLYFILEDDRIIGFYQLLKKELIERTDLSPWISCVFIDENRRGERLIEQLLMHGRIYSGTAGIRSCLPDNGSYPVIREIWIQGDRN
jgi:hypothetical protein